MKELIDLIATRLLQVKAMKIQPQSPFVWANGWQAPLYLDDRKILSYAETRNLFRLELARQVAEKYPDADVIAGVAVNAIAHGVMVAEQLGLPFVYVHPVPKDHGLENRIEGDLRPRQKVVVIENQISTGAAALQVVETLRESGCRVLGVVSIFDYQFPTTQRKFNEVGVELTSLTNFESVLRGLTERNLVNEAVEQELRAWHKAPTKWMK